MPYSRIEQFAVTLTAGTVITSPMTVSTTFADAIVGRIEVEVPPGPSGLVGFCFVHSQQQIIPWSTGAYIVADDKAFGWDIQDFPVGGKWSVRGYNTDVYDHTIQVRYLLNEIPNAPAVPLVAVPILAGE